MRDWKEVPVRPMELSPGMTVDRLVSEMGASGCFGAGRLSRAVTIYEEMVREDAMKFFGLAGAMVPGGMRKILADLLRLGYIDVLVTTGANLVHDLIEAFGGGHYQGTLGIEDGKLREEKVNRLYDVFLPEEGFLLLEERLRKLLGDLEAKEYTTREYLSEIGRRIPDPDSLLRSATDAEVPVFCPALPDSILGLHSYFSSRERGFRLDPFGDLKEIIDLCFQAEKSGVVLLGGGVPKNFLFQAMLASPHTFDYAVQITTDRPEAGGLSGASLDEAISWGKVGSGSKRVTVYADATIAFPLIVGALRERIGR